MSEDGPVRSIENALTPSQSLPDELTRDIERAGYYPALVCDVVATAVAGDQVVSHLVHQETTFDEDAVRRHITVLALTPNRLVVAHADDHTGDDHTEDHTEDRTEDRTEDHADRGDDDASSAGGNREQFATATSETVPLRAVRGVMLTHVVPRPGSYRAGSLGREVTVTIGWGAVNRVDLLPATCEDPNCEAEHGFDGTIAADDIGLRVSADADGMDLLRQAVAFSTALSAAIGR